MLTDTDPPLPVRVERFLFRPVILVGVWLVVLLVVVSARAQQQPPTPDPAPDASAAIARIEAKVDGLAERVGAHDERMVKGLEKCGAR
jgi:hypothetical protein